MSNVITIGIIAAIGFGVYEWLKSACVPGSSMAGGQICSGFNSLFGSASAPTVSTPQPSAPTHTASPAAAPTNVTPPPGNPQASSTPAPPTSTPNNSVPSSAVNATPLPCLIPAGYFVVGAGLAMDPNGSLVSAPGCAAPGSTPTPSVSSAAPAVENNVDVWSYDYQQVMGQPISPGTLQAAFPYLTSSNRGWMTDADFISAIEAQGMTGLGANLIPDFLIHRRRFA